MGEQLAEDELCNGRHDAWDIICRHLQPALPSLLPQDLTEDVVLRLSQEVSSRHREELAAAAPELMAEVLAGLPTGFDAGKVTLAELIPHAKSAQLRRHTCATNNTARSLARLVKQGARSKTAGLF